MPITFSCQCGRQLQMGDEYAGKKARCPECQAAVTVPFADAPPDPFAGPAFPPPLPSSAPPPPKLAPRARLDEPAPHQDDVGSTASSLNPSDARDGNPVRRRRRDEDEDDEDDRPRRRSDPPPRKLMNNSTIGGIVCLGIAFVLLVIAVSAGVVFLKGIIVLAIAGVIGIIRGLITGRDE